MHSNSCDKYNNDESKNFGNDEYHSWNEYKKILTKYLEGQKFIIKKEFVKYAIEKFNKNEYNFNFDLIRLNNFYYYWKSYKKISIYSTKKKKIIDLEYFIFITDFFIKKIKNSNDIFLDSLLKKPDNFCQIIII